MNSQKSYTVEEATRLLEKFCAYQERCFKDVENKLISIKMIPKAREIILLHLLENNFLNEERFANAFARGKFSIKHWGKRKIINELKIRNISEYNIKTSLLEINEDEYQKTIRILACKKIDLIKEQNIYIKKRKLSNYLLSKGYEHSTVYKIVNDLL